MTETKSILKAAICDFKKKGLSIKKTSDNPFFKSKYADLSAILTAIEADAADCGLVLISNLEYTDNGLVVKTVLEHKDSGESRVSVFPVFGQKPQEVGSSTTYARRYNIQALLNLAAEDDDGNAANNAKPTVERKLTQWKNFAERNRDMTAVEKALNETKTTDDLGVEWATLGAPLIKKLQLEGDDISLEYAEQLTARKDKLKKSFADMGV